MKELPRKPPPTYFVLAHAELPSIQQWQDIYGDLPINANVEFYSHGTGENTKV